MRASALLALASSQLGACGTILWDGRFNDMESATDLDKWSWSSQIGPYQWYIHGSGATTDYVNLSSDFKNPADTGSTQGVKITLDSTAYWNGQTMRRTELIPQTTAAINKGKVWYHFSISRSETNAPAETREHQIAFFESHFTELKAGWLSGSSNTSDPNLRWMANSQSQWNTEFIPGVWHNVAYEIDFDANTVGFWYSTGADDLVLTVEPVSVSASSNGADWHLGVLELPRDGYADTDEDLFFSGIYIESDSITTSVAGPGGAASGGDGNSTTTASTVAAAASSTTTALTIATTLQTSTTKAPSVSTTQALAASSSAATTGTAETCAQAKWAQCGGINWAGCSACASGTTCKSQNDYYSQCL
ncbi:carbohydrate-binding module family 1 protein [Biscogniauxia sp. FL1348]|nr:carbohydrate-binding module family 1 protein [Biscogniauxia sp. FL1348]